MSWVSIIVTGLKLLTSIMAYLNDKRLIQAGEDRAVARAALELLEKTQQGKELRERVKGLSDQEAANLWERMSKV
jgi:hypothetical protein